VAGAGGLLQEARALFQGGQGPRALTAYRRLLLLDPDCAPGWAGFGRQLLALNDAAAAEDACRRALALDPEQLEARLDLARCLMLRERLPEALALLEPAVAQAPGDPEVTTLLMNIFIRQGDDGALRREMLRRVDADFTGVEAQWERACVQLLCGDLAGGWEAFEARRQLPGVPAFRLRCPQPQWQGEPLAGRTLLLHWEQGFGDTLQFIRFAPQVRTQGGRVLLLAQRELADLAGTCPGVDQVVAHGDPLPPFDLYLPLLSLPRVLGTELATIPADIPYLEVPAGVPHRAALAGLLAPSRGRTRVGLCWSGSATHSRDRQRSLPPQALAPLGALPGVAWHSFQKEGEPAPLPGLVELGPSLGTFSDTAYALSGMDLVITVDTALAHLAGALGVPTLLLLAYLPDWRWLMGRDDSPWYPTLRLYRQTLPGDWAGVIRQVLGDLG